MVALHRFASLYIALRELENRSIERKNKKSEKENGHKRFLDILKMSKTPKVRRDFSEKRDFSF